MTHITRRAFLGALGATGVLAGLPSESAAEPGANASSGKPLRFLGIYTPHGRAHELWRPGPGFDLRYPDASLAPFDDAATYGKSFRGQLVVLDGIDLSAGIEVGTTGHDGPRAILTGSGADGKTASIDQFLAFECGLCAETPHSALAMAVGSDQSDIGSSISYAAGGEPYFDAITDLQIDLLARAFACDLSRFATLFLADLSRTKLLPDYPNDVHTDVAHRYDARTAKHPGTPATWRALARQNRYTYGKVARLLQRLDEAGVLEDTIVYVSSDMGDPARHSSRSVPTLIAGGGGRFRLGKYQDLRRTDGTGVPNNRILVSICQAFGVETTRFGHARDPKIVTGRLEELHA